MLLFNAPREELSTIEAFLHKQSSRVPWFRRDETYIAVAMFAAGCFFSQMNLPWRVAVLLLVPAWATVSTFLAIRKQRDDNTLASVVAAGVPLSEIISAIATYCCISALPALFAFLVGGVVAGAFSWRASGGSTGTSFFHTLDGLLVVLMIPCGLTGLGTYLSALLALKPALFARALARRVAVWVIALFALFVAPAGIAILLAPRVSNIYFHEPWLFWLLVFGVPAGVIGALAILDAKRRRGKPRKRSRTSGELEAEEIDQRIDL